MRLAKRCNGLAVLWEHRFYGGSLSLPVNENTTADEWQLLTTEQALEDVVFFANSFAHAGSRPLSNSSDTSDPLLSFPVHPSKTPHSSALMRIRNPEIIFASWASSEPVEAQVDMSSYYRAAERSLTRNCSADWVAITKYVDNTLNRANKTAIVNLKSDLRHPASPD
ncbi:peptidase S28 [Flammula alnicola]|nr:peptidase S28 [Flammula alnicola]